jgi:hypothetical protein
VPQRVVHIVLCEFQSAAEHCFEQYFVDLHRLHSSSFGFPGPPHAEHPSGTGVLRVATGAESFAFSPSLTFLPKSAATRSTYDTANSGEIAARVANGRSRLHASAGTPGIVSGKPCPRPHAQIGAKLISRAKSSPFMSGIAPSRAPYSQVGPCGHVRQRSTNAGRSCFHARASVFESTTFCADVERSPLMRAWIPGPMSLMIRESRGTAATSATTVKDAGSRRRLVTKRMVKTPSSGAWSWKTRTGLTGGVPDGVTPTA